MKAVFDRLVYRTVRNPFLRWLGIYVWNIAGMCLLYVIAFVHQDRANIVLMFIGMLLLSGLVIAHERAVAREEAKE